MNSDKRSVAVMQVITIILLVFCLVYTVYKRVDNARIYEAGISYYETGEYDKAIELLDPLVENNYKDAKSFAFNAHVRSLYSRGIAAFEDGKYEAAIEYFAMIGDFEDARSYLYESMRRSGKYEKFANNTTHIMEEKE